MQNPCVHASYMFAGHAHLLAAEQAQGNNLVKHANEVVLFPHDAAHDVMLCQIAHNTQPGRFLGLHCGTFETLSLLYAEAPAFKHSVTTLKGRLPASTKLTGPWLSER